MTIESFLKSHQLVFTSEKILTNLIMYPLNSTIAVVSQLKIRSISNLETGSRFPTWYAAVQATYGTLNCSPQQQNSRSLLESWKHLG